MGSDPDGHSYIIKNFSHHKLACSIEDIRAHTYIHTEIYYRVPIYLQFACRSSEALIAQATHDFHGVPWQAVFSPGLFCQHLLREASAAIVTVVGTDAALAGKSVVPTHIKRKKYNIHDCCIDTKITANDKYIYLLIHIYFLLDLVRQCILQCGRYYR